MIGSDSVQSVLVLYMTERHTSNFDYHLILYGFIFLCHIFGDFLGHLLFERIPLIDVAYAYIQHQVD